MEQMNDIVRNAIQVGKGLGSQLITRSKQLEDEYSEFMARWHIVSPTGRRIIRVDSQGDGVFGSPRGARIHTGIDWECHVNQDIYSMIDGRIVRSLTVYPGENWVGVEIANRDLICRECYINPDESLIGKEVKAGDIIGSAQNITLKYGGGMLPHIHGVIFLNYEGFLK
jgi:hypothetical protein